MDVTITGAVPHGKVSPSQPALRDLVAMESLKLYKRLMTRVVFGLMTVGMLGVMSIAYLTARTGDYATEAERQDQINSFLLPQVLGELPQVIGGLGSILIVMLAASMIGSEYGWGTVRVLVSSGVSRTRLMVAKLLALVEAVVLFVVAGMVSGIVGSLVLTLVGGHDLSFSWVDGTTAADVMLIVVRLTFLLLVPAIIAFTVAIVSRSLAVGIALGIGFQIAEQILSALLGSIGSLGERLRDLLFTTNLAAIDQLNAIGTRDIDPSLPDAWQAAGTLALYCAVLVAVSIVVFRRRDITSGS
jgi:ABC-type transport system involved in multi-copper enzyme maturation permease subunit